jgi:predicted dehydrogenase
MNKISLVIGMGIGRLYKEVLQNLGYTVITVDLNPDLQAMYTDINKCLEEYPKFDTVHICTPNFTHYDIACQVANKAGIVFVEKPGVKNADEWLNLVSLYPETRFMMVKNNQYRGAALDIIKESIKKSKFINLTWINNDRIPNPGTWFTTKELAYGGVSRDLMPHLLSLFIALEPDYMTANVKEYAKFQRWQLDQITQTDYGIIKKDGTYDVDDYCGFKLEINGRIWAIVADWRSLEGDKSQIACLADEINQIDILELGLCHESAYQSMIELAVKNINNNKFWLEQFVQDYWIHKRIE